MNKITPVVIAIIVHKDKYLLTQRKNDDEEDAEFGKNPIWHFPGGELEFGEEFDKALIREIKEETNLSICVEKQLPHVYSAVRKYWHGVLIPYLCYVVGKSDVQLDHESIGYGWFSYEEALRLHSLPFVREMLDDAVLSLKK